MEDKSLRINFLGKIQKILQYNFDFIHYKSVKIFNVEFLNSYY